MPFNIAEGNHRLHHRHPDLGFASSDERWTRGYVISWKSTTNPAMPSEFTKLMPRSMGKRKGG